MSKRPGVLVTRFMSHEVNKALEERFEVFHLWEIQGDGEKEEREAFVRRHCLAIRAIAGTAICAIPASLIDALPALEIISISGVGLNYVDMPLCQRRGIRVCSTPDALTDCTADHALLLFLATSRRLCPADRYVRQGLWSVQGFPLTRKASGKRIGIVGLGRIGKAIAKRMEAFGCAICYNGKSLKPEVPYTYYASVADMAANVDVLVIACPLTNDTHHLIDREVIDSLGPQGMIVNIGRGAIIDESELVKALQEGRLGAASLDVFENEPCVPPELLKMDNVVLTPHCATGTWETRKAMSHLMLANLDAHFSRKPLLTPVI